MDLRDLSELVNNDKAMRNFSYTLGTDYFLISHRNEMKPITFDISYNGSECIFTPDEYIDGLWTKPIAFKTGILDAVTKLMTAVCVFTRSHTISKNRFDKRFILKSGNNVEVVTYVDYTNDMVMYDDTDYEPLCDYIFPHTRHHSGWFVKKEEFGSKWDFGPKELLTIRYADKFNTSFIPFYDDSFNGYYQRFLREFKKDEKTLKALSALKIKDMLDIPTKFVVYGLCNKFGKDQDKLGIVSILYIEHKTSLSDYAKFKELCNKKLDEELKPLNMTHEDIININWQILKEKFPDYKSVEKLARACGHVSDPRGLLKSTLKQNYYGTERETSDKYCLKRWMGIGIYYPELFNGLKTVYNYYKSLRGGYDEQERKKYIESFNRTANEHFNEVINLESPDIFKDQKGLISYVKKYLDTLKPIKIKNWKRLIDICDSINQDILDRLSEIYTKYYKDQIIKYHDNHPRARQMEFVHDLPDLFKGQNSIIQSLFTYDPFANTFLPKEIQQIFDKPELKLVHESLESFRLYFGGKLKFYVDNTELISYRNNSKNQEVYKIPNLDEAERSFEVVITGKADGDEHSGFKDNFVELRDLNRIIHNGSTVDPTIKISVQEFEEILNAFLASPIKFEVNWEKARNGYGDAPALFAIEDEPETNNEKFEKGWNYDANTLDMDAFLKQYRTKNKIGNFINFKIACIFQNPEIIIEKLKQMDFYKKAIGEIAWR